MSLHLQLKEYEALEANGEDPLYVQRLGHFRNLQVHDEEFVRKKEKVLWPLLQLPLNGVASK